MDAPDETAYAPVRDLFASYPPELRKLNELDEALSPIAAGVADLREELTRLRGQSEKVAKLLEEGQAELAESELQRSRLADECTRLQGERAEARAALAEAAKELEGLRTRAESLEHTLQQRDAELAESERACSRLADECAREREDRTAAQAALGDVRQELDGRVAEVATLEREVGSLGLRVSELETLQAAAPGETREPELASHLRLVSQSSGYELSEGAGPPPNAGELIDVNGRRLCVVRVGRSPLPGDDRACAFLVSDSEQAASPPTAFQSGQGPGVNSAVSRADKHESHARGEQHAERRDPDDARREARHSL